MTNDVEKLSGEVRKVISEALERSILQICGGGSDILLSLGDKTTSSIRQNIVSSISFPNKTNISNKKQKQKITESVDGKPHDVECRVALSLFHQWRRKQQLHRQQQIEKNLSQPQNGTIGITIISDMGVEREVVSPKELATIISPMLEEEFRRDRISVSNSQHVSSSSSSSRDCEEDSSTSPTAPTTTPTRFSVLSPDVRVLPSGMLCFWTIHRTQQLRRAGRIPCPYQYCNQWCKGEKGLWWHQQQYHKAEYADAAATASAMVSAMTSAIVIYRGKTTSQTEANTAGTLVHETQEQEAKALDPMECIKDGDVEGLKRLLSTENDKIFDPSKFVDSKGATPLMWAAGSGHLPLVQYLIEIWGCDPRTSQKGRRSFSGRTALHWACRNGHLPVVKYLVKNLKDTEQSSQTLHGGKDMNISRNNGLDSATQDGTTAFGWASWQRHLHVMEFLYQQGSNIHSVNSFGCNCVLWCAQGTDNSNVVVKGQHDGGDIQSTGMEGKGLVVLKWLQSKGCDMTLVNHNGHGVLHKCAQRGQGDVGEWFCNEFLGAGCQLSDEQCLSLLGPDVEGYCPSDLAGMEGHESFATLLAEIEVEVCGRLQKVPDYDIPEDFTSSAHCIIEFEKYGGLRRMRQAVSKKRNGVR